MCLLVVQHNNKNSKKSLRFTRTMFDTVWEQNPHGFGLGWFRNKKPVQFHSMDKEEAWKGYIKHWDEFTGEMLVHWRYATQGLKDESNCHPFLTNTPTPWLLAHNGVISPTPKCPHDWSDTRWFAHSLGEILKHPEEPGHHEDEKEVKFYLGASRLAIVTPENRLHTWNFPTQAFDLIGYGLFSINGLCRRKSVSQNCYTGQPEDNWERYANSNKSAINPAYRERTKDYRHLPYIDPSTIDEDAFSRPHTFFLYEALETNAFLDFEVLMRRFYNRFKRFPASTEIAAAISLSTRNRSLKPKEAQETKEEKAEVNVPTHGL